MIDGPLTPVRRKFAGLAGLFSVVLLVGMGLSVARLRLPEFPARVTRVDEHGFAYVEVNVRGRSVQNIYTGLEARGLAQGESIMVRCDTTDTGYGPSCRAPANAQLWLALLGMFALSTGLCLALYSPELRAWRDRRRVSFGGGARARPPGG